MSKSKLFFALITLIVITSFAFNYSDEQTVDDESSLEYSLPIPNDTIRQEENDPYKRYHFEVLNPRLEKSEEVVDFRYRGRTINHLILSEFIGFASSDGASAIREIDLTIGNESNRFYINEKGLYLQKLPKLNYIVYAFKETYNSDEQFLKYAYLGKLDNGVHIVFFEEDGGGTYQEKHLIGVRFTKEKVYYDKKPHVFIKCVKVQGINQYVDFKIDPVKNRLRVIPKENYAQQDFSDMSKKPFWVDFPLE